MSKWESQLLDVGLYDEAKEGDGDGEAANLLHADHLLLFQWLVAKSLSMSSEGVEKRGQKWSESDVTHRPGFILTYPIAPSPANCR